MRRTRILLFLISFFVCVSGYTQPSFIPSDLPGLAVWLRSDSGIIFGTPPFVQQMSDASGNGNHAIQNTAGQQPVLINNVPLLNNQSVLHFDNTQNNVLEIADNPSIDFTTRMTVFILAKEEALASNMALLGKWDYNVTFPGSWVLITAASGAELRAFIVLDAADAGDNIVTTDNAALNPQFYFFSMVYNGGELTDVDRVKFRKNFTLLSTTFAGSIDTTLENTTASLKVGRFGGNFPGYFNGDIGEVIIYNDTLSTAQRDSVQQYLRYKYAPPVNLGPDIVSNDLCPDTLDASPRFISYLWNTGDTTQTIVVTHSGTYTVNVTDVFGFTSSDTIDVTFPSFNEPPVNTVLCINDSLLWNTSLSSSVYNFLWSTGDTTSFIYIDSAGQYWVTATDSLGCSLTSDTVTVVIDSFPVVASLGPDKSLCSGNSIALTSGAAQAQTYLWSDSSTGTTLTIQTSGTYWVSVTDSNNCVARDSITITIVGVAPSVNFSALTVCQGDTTFFTDLTPASDTAVAWSWNFGEPSSGPSNFSTLQNPSHLYADSGTFMVTLIDTTLHGCYNDTAIAARVYPNPVPSFIHSIPCTGAPVQFTNETDSVGYHVTSWLWNFGDPASGVNDTSSLKNPSHIYNTSGNFPVTLTVTLNNGCSVTDTTVVSVGLTVVPSFSFFNTCIGDITSFFTSASGVSLIWNFGDNTASTQQNPQHQYAFVQMYPCTLIAITMANCTSSVTLPVVIHDVPVAYFQSNSACLNVPYHLLDSSYISQGTITQWLWKFPDFSMSILQNPYYTFNDTLQYNITLVVTSNYQCKDTAIRTVKVHPLPTASFTSDVTYGDVPLDVDFTNLSSGAASYQWDFGDTIGTSTVISPSYTYTERGTYPVMLIANTLYNCSDTTVKYIYVVEPILDLSITSVNKTSGTNSISLSAGIANLGNIAVSSFKISAWLENSLPVFEYWNGNFPPQSTLQPPYNFATNFEIPQINPPHFLCVEILEVNNQQDNNPDNNIRCINLDGDDFVVVDPYPNPAAQVINLQVVASRKDFLSISVYDASGKLIKEVYNGLTTAGLNKFIFDTSSLAGGTYFCKYTFSAKTIVRPLTHIAKKK